VTCLADVVADDEERTRYIEEWLSLLSDGDIRRLSWACKTRQWDHNLVSVAVAYAYGRATGRISWWRLRWWWVLRWLHSRGVGGLHGLVWWGWKGEEKQDEV